MKATDRERKSLAATVIVVAILALIVGAVIMYVFIPDSGQELLKEHELERKEWLSDIDILEVKVDSLTQAALLVQKKADSTVNSAESKTRRVQRELNRLKNEEINDINNVDGYYLDVLSAPRSN